MSDDVESVAAARAAAERLEAAVVGLRDDVQEATSAFRATSRRQRLFLVGLTILVALVAWLALSNHSTAQTVARQTVTAKVQATCVRDYTNANADRTNKLLPLSNARSDALDALIRTLPAAATDTPAQQKALFTQKLLAYLKASDTYSAAVQANPPPLAPKFTC